MLSKQFSFTSCTKLENCPSLYFPPHLHTFLSNLILKCIAKNTKHTNVNEGNS